MSCQCRVTTSRLTLPIENEKAGIQRRPFLGRISSWLLPYATWTNLAIYTLTEGDIGLNVCITRLSTRKIAFLGIPEVSTCIVWEFSGLDVDDFLHGGGRESVARLSFPRCTFAWRTGQRINIGYYRNDWVRMYLVKKRIEAYKCT